MARHVHFILLTASMMTFQIIVQSWIMRSSCKVWADFEVKITDHVLERRRLSIYSVSSVHECFERCTKHSRCMSVNYIDDRKDNCEINSLFKEIALLQRFTRKEGWTYYSTNYTRRNVGLNCINLKPCAENDYCFDTCECPGYQCIKPCASGQLMDYQLKCKDIANIALSKTVLHSGSLSGSRCTSCATDGIKSTIFSECTIAADQPSWLAVNLGRKALIEFLKILGANSAASLHVKIHIGDVEDSTQNPLCSEYVRLLNNGQQTRVYCQEQMMGKYVYISSSDAVEICELEVFGIFLM